MAVAVVRRLATILLLAGAALASVGAAPAEEREMLRAVSDALTAMAYAASGLCLFAIVWAGFVLMAEGGRGAGRGPGQERRRGGGGGAGPGAVGQGRRGGVAEGRHPHPVGNQDRQGEHRVETDIWKDETAGCHYRATQA